MESPRESYPSFVREDEKIVSVTPEASRGKRVTKIMLIVLADLVLLAITIGLIYAMWLPGIIRSRH